MGSSVEAVCVRGSKDGSFYLKLLFLVPSYDQRIPSYLPYLFINWAMTVSSIDICCSVVSYLFVCRSACILIKLFVLLKFVICIFVDFKATYGTRLADELFELFQYIGIGLKYSNRLQTLNWKFI